MKTPVVLALALLASAPAARAAQPASAFPAPDRPVASIVSPIWSTGPSRDEADEDGQLVRALGIKAGMTVADIGAGSGYHTTRLSPVVGARGRVYAQDVMESYLTDLRATVARDKLKNVEIVLGSPADPNLPRASVDRAILVHMYHEITQPYGLIWNLADALKAGARVGVVDLDRAPQNHGMPPALLRCEFEAVGYRQVSFQVLEGGVGYLAIFNPPQPGARPAPAAIKPCKAGR
jgi:predicted methyltransferase